MSLRYDEKGLVHISGLLLLALILAIIGIVGWRVFSAQRANNTTSTNESTNNNPEDLHFTDDIFDPAAVASIGPLGELNGGHVEAQAVAGVLINLRPEVVADGKEIEVRAPAPMTLESYAHFKDPIGGQVGWSLTFRLSPDVTMRLDHITRASDKIISATTSTPKSDSREEYPKSKINFKAGEVVAYTSGTSVAHNWNIYLYDKQHKNTFINQARYEDSHVGRRLINATCPFNYYDDAKKATFLALMGQRKPGETTSCGEVSRDKAGTLAGMWHFSPDAASGMEESKNGKFESPFSIYKNSAGVISINQVDGKRLDVEPGTATNKDPADITTQHCYEVVDANQQKGGYVFLKLEDSTKMALTYSPNGKCPANFPAAEAKTYYR